MQYKTTLLVATGVSLLGLAQHAVCCLLLSASLCPLVRVGLSVPVAKQEQEVGCVYIPAHPICQVP